MKLNNVSDTPLKQRVNASRARGLKMPDWEMEFLFIISGICEFYALKIRIVNGDLGGCLATALHVKKVKRAIEVKTLKCWSVEELKCWATLPFL